MHSTTTINKKAAELISLVERATDGRSQKSTNRETFLGTGKSIKVEGEVDDFKAFKTNEYGRIISAFKSSEIGKIGISEKNYPLLLQVIEESLELFEFSSKVDQEYIETKLFDWVIRSHIDQKMEREFLSYLQYQIDIDAREYTFYFKIIPLIIESPFSIGGVEITVIDTQKLTKSIEDFKREAAIDRDDLGVFFKDYEDNIIAKCTTYGVQERADFISKYKSRLAINALKIFHIRHSLDLSYQMFDLDFEGLNNSFSSYLYETDEPGFTFMEKIQRVQGAQPITVSDEQLKKKYSDGLEELSHFLKNTKSGTLYQEITSGVNHLGNLLSNRNLYDRVVHLISFFERFLISKKSGKAYGQTRIKKNILPRLFSTKSKREELASIVNNFYRVRDRYLHNKVEFPIDIFELYEFQSLAVKFLIYLIRLNNKISDFEDAVDHLEQSKVL